ncbi:MAG: hypothetical protein WA666_00385 [Nitrospirota bacterium]
MEQYTPELITIEEFAKRMSVCRATAFDWKAHGRVKPGRDFIQIGRTVRFLWGPELLKNLQDDCQLAAEQPSVEKKKRPVKLRNKGKASINLDY